MHYQYGILIMGFLPIILSKLRRWGRLEWVLTHSFMLYGKNVTICLGVFIFCLLINMKGVEIWLKLKKKFLISPSLW